MHPRRLTVVLATLERDLQKAIERELKRFVR